MARKLTGRFEVNSVIPVTGTSWDVQGNFTDEVGLYGPADVQIGMMLFLYSSLDGVMRYSISNVSGGANPITIRVNWDDEGAPVEPPANFGALCAVTDTGLGLLPEEPSFQQQLLDEPLVSGIRSQTFRVKLRSPLLGTYVVGSGVTIVPGRAICKNGTDVIFADNSSQTKAAVVGISLAGGTIGDSILVCKGGSVPVGIITASCFIENVLPTDGSWVFLANANGKLTIQAPIDNATTWETLLGSWDNGTLNLQINQWGTTGA